MLRRDRIGFIFQAFNLVPTLTARENITLPMRLAGRKRRPGVDRPGHRAPWASPTGSTHRPVELSGGQQQRVAVARALASRPEIIFADEPTGNLDSRAGAEVLRFLRQAVDELGQTIVMVTHDPIAASYADRIVFLADGRIVDEMHDPTAERRARADEALRGVIRHVLDHAARACSPTSCRLFATALAVTLGVAFMAGTLDPHRHRHPTFDNLLGERLRGTDAVVRGQEQFAGRMSTGAQRARVDDALVDDGARGRRASLAAEGSVFGYARLIDRGRRGDRRPGQRRARRSDSTGPTTAASTRSSSPRAARPGRRTRSSIDTPSLEKSGDSPLGDRMTVLVQARPVAEDGRRDVAFGSAETTGGATMVAFHPSVAQRAAGRARASGTRSRWSPRTACRRQALAARLAASSRPGWRSSPGRPSSRRTRRPLHEAMSFFTYFMLTSSPSWRSWSARS